MSLGHHPDRMTNVSGDPMDWDTHQVVHQGEREVLESMGLNQQAFNTGFGNEFNPDNLPPRRVYGND